MKPKKSRAKEIWTLLTKYFGPDYFLDAVQVEYGIGPGQSDKISQEIKRHF